MTIIYHKNKTSKRRKSDAEKKMKTKIKVPKFPIFILKLIVLSLTFWRKNSRILFYFLVLEANLGTYYA